MSTELDEPKKVPNTGNRGMGRPKGATNKVGRELRTLCQEYTEDAVATLLDIMWAGDSDAARAGAAKEILDRGHGKATQVISLPTGWQQLPTDELLKLREGKK